MFRVHSISNSCLDFFLPQLKDASEIIFIKLPYTKSESLKINCVQQSTDRFNVRKLESNDHHDLGGGGGIFVLYTSWYNPWPRTGKLKCLEILPEIYLNWSPSSNVVGCTRYGDIYVPCSFPAPGEMPHKLERWGDSEQWMLTLTSLLTR